MFYRSVKKVLKSEKTKRHHVFYATSTLSSPNLTERRTLPPDWLGIPKKRNGIENTMPF